MIQTVIYRLIGVLAIAMLAACSARTSQTLGSERFASGYHRLGTMDIEQFQLSAFSYREGASAPTGKSAKGGCGCN